ncbi:MAG TPA: amidohydrolase family protein [Phycisphaerales bacterium]|nr:amidohydrolase family protein [Phycisphaerales bacterium]
MLTRMLSIAASLAVSLAALAQETPIAFTNARIYTVAGDTGLGELAAGTLLVHRGKIVSVGDNVDLPQDAQVIDAKGKTIIPGLVDTHSHIGGVGGADQSGTIQPDVRVYDSINPLDSGFRRAVAGGLTTLNIMPGSGHLLSGQTVYVKLRGGKTIDDLFIHPPAGSNLVDPMGGMKMANGTNSIGAPPFSGTRGKSAAMVRERYIKAQEYRQKIIDAGDDKSKMPDRDLALEGLVEVLEGKRIVHHHTHRTDDIMTVLRLQKEFGFRVVLQHVSEAWKIPKELAAAQRDTAGKLLGCSVILVDSPGGKLEALHLDMHTAGVLERAGVNVCIHTDDWINDSRHFLRSGALAVRFGMTRAGALRALTIDGAKMMDLADRVGSLEAGKDADFVVLSGDPFSTYTKVETTWVEGVKVFDLSNKDDALFATGGFGAGRDQEPYMCCAPSGGFTFGGKQWQ